MALKPMHKMLIVAVSALIISLSVVYMTRKRSQGSVPTVPPSLTQPAFSFPPTSSPPRMTMAPSSVVVDDDDDDDATGMPTRIPVRVSGTAAPGVMGYMGPGDDEYGMLD